jgi:hypothetical protein
MAGVTRELAGEFVSGAAEVVGSSTETEMQAFDEFTLDEVDRARGWLRLDPAYRAAVGALDSDSGKRAV